MINNKIVPRLNEKYNFCNITKIIIILIILFIIYRLCTYQFDIYKPNSIESFVSLQYNYYGYGNTISLQNTKNKPAYTANQCKFLLDNTYRIDSLIFKFNSGNDVLNRTTKFTNNTNNSNNIFIQYIDGNNNLRYLKTPTITTSPPNLQNLITGSGTNSDLYILNLSNIVDENGLTIYTSQIIMTIGNDILYKIDLYNDSDNFGYIKEYGIFGGTRSLLLKNEYDDISTNLSYYNFSNIVDTTDRHLNNLPNDVRAYIFKYTDNIKIYSLKLNIAQTPQPITTDPPVSPPTATTNNLVSSNTPFYIKIKYSNLIYPSNDFTIDKTYIIRSDINKLFIDNEFIFLEDPIIANQLIFEIQMPPSYNLVISSVAVNGLIPLLNDINDYKRSVNVQLNQANSNDLNLCPNIDTLLETQTKTQQICDNLEYQDKIKSEKLRLERNKQYLLKLKKQQEQVDELNSIIQDLENKRANRDTISDQVRVLQYQKQKGDAASIRDLANQRLESQDNNKLYMDVKLNYT